MQPMLFALLLCVSTAASADWLKVGGDAAAPADVFIDSTAIRQSGPMNTMRRVWELRNLGQPRADLAWSVKSHVEYDCKDRRRRVLDAIPFAAHWAQGSALPHAAQDAWPEAWRNIDQTGLHATVFKRVCPNDD